jgi:hypothetical protein
VVQVIAGAHEQRILVFGGTITPFANDTFGAARRWRPRSRCACSADQARPAAGATEEGSS